MRRALFADQSPLARGAGVSVVTDPRDATAHGLSAHWPFAPARGGHAIPDAVGGQGPVSLSATPPTWTPDATVGVALRASGDASWGVIGARPGLSPARITVCCWFRWTHGGTNRAMFSRWRASAQSWLLRASAASGRPAFNISTSAGGFEALSPVTFNDGRWHHLAGVYDGASARLYVDGVPRASAAAYGTLSDPAIDVYLFRYSNDAVVSDFFVGDLADPRIYRRALSPAEVWRLWAPQTRWATGAAMRRSVSIPFVPDEIPAEASLGGVATLSPTPTLVRCADASPAGVTIASASATRRRVRKEATFEPPSWGEFAAPPSAVGAGAAIEQSADAAFVDGCASEAGAGAKVTLSPGDGSVAIEHALAPSAISHARVMLRAAALAGGAVDVMAAVDEANAAIVSLRLDSESSELSLRLPSGGAIACAIDADAWEHWRCVEAAIDGETGLATLWVDGVEAGSSLDAPLADASVSGWRLGALYKDHAAAGELHLDRWAMGPAYLGPPVVRPSGATLDDPARWLIVCNRAAPGSLEWARAYRWARNIPHANVLALDAPTGETITEEAADLLCDRVRGYLDATGLVLQVAGVLLGPGVPGFVESGDPGDTDAPRTHADWLMTRGASAESNSFFAGGAGALSRPRVAGAHELVVAARMDAADADIAVAMLTRALRIEQDDGSGADRRLFVDANAPSEAFTSAVSRLSAWSASVDCMRLRLPVTIAPVTGGGGGTAWEAFADDGFFWGWRDAAVDESSFVSGAGDRVFFFALRGSAGDSPSLREGGGWARSAILAGYAATAAGTAGVGTDDLPDARVFFEALRRGWTLGEAWLVSCPRRGVGLTLVGDPLMRVRFPRAGWDVFGPARDAESIDFTAPALALRDEDRSVTLPDSARPAGNGSAVYALRRVDERGRSEAGATLARVEVVEGAISAASMNAPAWPDYEGWPVTLARGEARAIALWDRPCSTLGVARAILESLAEGGTPATVAEVTPSAWASRVEACVNLTATPVRLRWRVVSASGASAVTPWSAPVSGVSGALVEPQLLEP